MPFHSTRRGFIVGSLLLPLTSAAHNCDLEIPATTAEGSEAAELIKRRDDLLDKRRILDERWKVAYEQMPEWCKPGRQFCDQDGNPFGPIVGWPPSLEPIAVDAHKLLVRPSPYDLRKVLKAETRAIRKKNARNRYRRRIADQRSRLTERRQLARSVGLPKTVDWLAIDLEIENIEDLLSIPH